MPDLLLEFFSEEIPARMQARAAEDLKKLVTDKLVAASLPYEGAKAFATPRRLALAVAGIPVRQPDVKEERKGPRVGAPQNAIAGFLKAAGLSSIEQAKVQPDKKGDFYVATIEKAGKPAIEVIGEIVPEVVRNFPWPKSMRWGERSATQAAFSSAFQEDAFQTGSLRWVRPLHSIVATFGPETEEPEVVPFNLDGIASGDTTFGHRFMAPQPIKVKRLDDYMSKLDAAKVVVDPERRAQMILHDAKTLAFAQGYELVHDEGLLAEVAGLVEWPVVLMGAFDQDFLEIPEEVIRATIRNNQKCFVVRDPQTAKLVNKFILVSNIEASDGGKAIVAGCERVIRARLSDAKFFYETDLKTRLEDRLPKFEHIVFHEKLGTQAERIARIERLAKTISELIEDQKHIGRQHYQGSAARYLNNVKRAARLSKTDLLTEMVGEFPELQGLMGRYYAQIQGEEQAVSHAIEDHYRPKGPDDLVPADPVSVAVALADKIDILTGFWAIDEKPTGSKDPYALRRAALGVIRIILNSEIRLSLQTIFYEHAEEYFAAEFDRVVTKERDAVASAAEVFRSSELLKEFDADTESGQFVETQYDYVVHRARKVSIRLLDFFQERLKNYFREIGAKHDLVDAVFARPDEEDQMLVFKGQDDLILILRRVEALGKFLDTDDGKNLLAGFKRAANILRIEEKKDNASYGDAPDASLLTQAEEKELARAVGVTKTEAGEAIRREDFAAAMTAMSKLRPHVDAFFDKVTVNVDDRALRANRLRLLNEIREATRSVADFSKIEGG